MVSFFLTERVNGFSTKGFFSVFSRLVSRLRHSFNFLSENIGFYRFEALFSPWKGALIFIITYSVFPIIMLVFLVPVEKCRIALLLMQETSTMFSLDVFLSIYSATDVNVSAELFIASELAGSLALFYLFWD